MVEEFNIYAALVFSIGLVGCSEKTSDEEALIKEASNKETLPLGDNEDGKVSQEVYKQIKGGMTSEEVFNIVGSKGTALSDSDDVA